MRYWFFFFQIQHIILQIKRFPLHKHLTGHPVAEWSLLTQLAATHIHLVHLLVQTELEGLEISASMRVVTERLLLGHSTRAPEVVLGTKHRVLDLEIKLADQRYLQHTARAWPGLGKAALLPAIPA